jgi:uncharacterized protein (DUF2235 family)
MNSKNIALFFDGTWNKAKTNTNVHKGFDPICLDKAESNGTQLTHYIPGVGVAFWTWLRGGAFGLGIQDNILEGYDYLVEHYNEGDRIFLFGFSRGAYTARSLAGMIVRYGLVRRGSKIGSNVIFDAYTKKKEARQITALRNLDAHELNPLEEEILSNSRRVDIHFMGLWDTVGMIGVPKGDRFGLNSEHKFHHQNVSTLYQNIAHAVSINENRGLFKPTLFFKYEPDDITPEKRAKNLARFEKRVEQRWFAGSHGCVGGSEGNPNEVLALAWIYDKAAKAGLMLRAPVNIGAASPTGKIGDSFRKFAFGLGALVSRRHHREIGRGTIQNEGFTLACLNEKIDGSVFDRCRADPKYRPKNLVDWAFRKGVDLAQAKGDKQV